MAGGGWHGGEGGLASHARSPGCTGSQSISAVSTVSSEQLAASPTLETRVLRSMWFVRKLAIPRAEWRRHGEISGGGQWHHGNEILRAGVDPCMSRISASINPADTPTRFHLEMSMSI